MKTKEEIKIVDVDNPRKIARVYRGSGCVSLYFGSCELWICADTSYDKKYRIWFDVTYGCGHRETVFSHYFDLSPEEYEVVEVNSKKDFEVEESINGIMTRRIARDLALFYTSALNFPKGEFVPFFEHSKEEWEEYIHYLIKEVADDPEREIEVVPNRKRSVFEIFNAHR